MADGLENGEQLYPKLQTVALAFLQGSHRFQALDKLEAYYRCTQYDSRRYDWDGRFRGYGEQADISPGWYVPIRLRRPTARYDLARLIVRRFTSMVFGAERFPQIVVDGDEDAQDYVRELAKAARLPLKLQEIRNKGGAQGSAVASFGYVDGKPRVSVHNAKHITILGWEDRYEQRPSAVLESYAYKRQVWDTNAGKSREVTLYFARYWDTEMEITWDPIPEEFARTNAWSRLKRTEIRHGYGFCPVYWVQNVPDTESVDGDSDFEGQCDSLDEMNILLSATGKGTVANVDPTLVIMDERSNNTGIVKKGSENAIWSKGGAKYLELTGTSLDSALKLLAELEQQTLDTVGVVLGDPNEMAAKVQSAAALRVLYMPMITQSDILREQYGKFMVQLLTGMLRAARMIIGQEPGPVVTTADGERMQERPTVTLPPRVFEEPGPNGEVVKRTEERLPGESEDITLNWPPYFPNTWTDTKQAVEALQAARGGQSAIISRKTAVENVASLFGIADVQQEMDDIDNDKATDVAFMQAAMGPGPGEDDDDGPGGEDGGKPPKE